MFDDVTGDIIVLPVGEDKHPEVRVHVDNILAHLLHTLARHDLSTIWPWREHFLSSTKHRIFNNESFTTKTSCEDAFSLLRVSKTGILPIL